MNTHKLERSRAGGHVSALLIAVITTAPILSSVAQATESVRVPVGASPAAKPAQEDARFADNTVQATGVRGPGGMSISIQTQDGTRSLVKLGDAVNRVMAIHRFETRLIVLGRLADGGATEVCIVDWTNGRVVDRFWAYDPAVSPDASMIAFVRFYPLHFVAGVESQYRLYRVRGSAQANRSFYRGQLAEDAPEQADAGQPLFAEAKGRAPRDNFEVASDQAHTHLSRLVWSTDSRRFGVIDAHGKTVRALVVSVDGAEGVPVAQPIDGLDSICLPARNEDCDSLPFDAVSLAFDAAGDSLRLKINDRSIFPKGFAKTLPLKGFASLP